MGHHQDEYAVRINRVIDHIQANLDAELRLDDLAKIACFSPYHFHRIFKAAVGETLRAFVGRVRLEAAAGALAAHPHVPVTHVALDFGFASPSTFARAFRAHFGMSATEWRERKKCKAQSNPRTLFSKPGGDGNSIRLHLHPQNNNPVWEVEMNALESTVTVEDIKTHTVAYIRHVGPYQGDVELFGNLWSTLMQWAVPRGVLGHPTTRTLCVYHDDPDITEPEKLRVSVCITVPEPIAGEDAVSFMTIEGGRYAVGRFELGNKDYPLAWQSMFQTWLPQSGFTPAEGPCFEVYESAWAPGEKQKVAIHIPVRPL